MFLRVSKKVGMWGFGPLWFTFADPKPQKIDLTELDELTQDKVKLAMAQGVLIRTDRKGEPIQEQRPQAQPVQHPIVDEVVTLVPVISPVIARKLTELLKNGVTTLRREIPRILSRANLNAALQFEKEGKNRKTVIALLEKTIGKTKDITLQYDDLIKDEDIEVVTFKVEDMVLETKDEVVEVELLDEESLGPIIKKKVEEL